VAKASTTKGKTVTDRVAITAILRMGVGPTRTDQDLVAAEAPLTVEIIQPDSDARERLGLLMRTPGDDDDLIRGHLLTEGIIGTSGEILRIVLHPDEDGGTRAEVTLAEEAGYLQRYLDIQKVRFGDRLSVSLDIPGELLSAKVPNLLLQPLDSRAAQTARKRENYARRHNRTEESAPASPAP
jgi:formate dehydrogenase assembly factor FdhD